MNRARGGTYEFVEKQIMRIKIAETNTNTTLNSQSHTKEKYKSFKKIANNYKFLGFRISCIMETVKVPNPSGIRVFT